MEKVVQLPARKGFTEQERNRIAAVAADAGACVQWHRAHCGAILGYLGNRNGTLGTIAREDGMVLWFPRDALSPLLAHVSLDECLSKVRRVL